MRNPQIKLGYAYKDEFGSLHGHIRGLGLGVTDFVAAKSITADGNTFYRMVANPLHEPYEIGAIFPQEKEGLSYFSVSIDSPLLPRPINAALFPDKNNINSFNLVWTRPEAKLDTNIAAQPRRFVGANAPAP